MRPDASITIAVVPVVPWSIARTYWRMNLARLVSAGISPRSCRCEPQGQAACEVLNAARFGNLKFKAGPVMSALTLPPCDPLAGETPPPNRAERLARPA